MARPALTVRTRIEAEDAASPNVAKAQGAFARFGEFLRTRFVFTLNDVSNIARAAFDRIFDTAKLEGQTQALRIQLAQQGSSFDTFIAKLNEVARGTVSTADLIASSSQALLLGIPAEKIAELLDIARASAIATGRSTADAFGDIAVGIGRVSPMILDNLGIVLKLEPAYDRAATALGKTVDQLTPAEQKAAILNEVLAVGRGRVKAYGEAQSALATGIEKAAAAQANFQEGVSKGASILGTYALKIVVAAAGGFASLAGAIVLARIQWNIWTGDLVEAAEISRTTGTQIRDLLGRLDALGKTIAEVNKTQLDQFLGRAGDAADVAARKAAQLAAAAQDTQDRLNGVGTGAAALATGLDAAASSSEDLAGSLNNEASAAFAAAEGQTALAAATEASGIAAVFSSRAFDELARASGRAAAVAGAIAGGGQVTLGGTRVSIFNAAGQRIGSRLTSEPGINGGRYV